MAIDRGGLEYPIDVQDQFSGNLAKFREGVANSRAEWQKFREEMGKPLGQSLAKATGPSPAVQQAREERTLAREKVKTQKQIDTEARRLERQRVRDNQQSRRDRTAEEQLSVKFAGAERKRIEEVDRTRADAEKRRSRRQSEATKRDDANFAKQEKAQGRLAKAAEKIRVQSRKLAREKAADARVAQRDADKEVTRQNQRVAQAKKAAVAEKISADRIAASAERLQSTRNAGFAKSITAQEKFFEGRQAAEVKHQESVAAGEERLRRNQETTNRARQAGNRKAIKDFATLQNTVEAGERAKRTEIDQTARRRSAEDAAVVQRARAAEISAIRLAETKRRASLSQERSAAALQKSNKGASQLLFTFRRLVGVLALFTAARLLVRALRDAVGAAIGFNAAIEQSVLGIQTLLAATGKLSTVQGRLLTGAEAFAAANGEARRQVALLRVEGLKTAATFEDLLFAFQSALGPGIAAGLSPDQVRGFAVSISQAANAVGVPQNQLAEEVRSVLSGTIQARTTRIATVLGIDNEDIRRAKEAGELADFLVEKFGAFREAGDASLNNFTVILSNLKDGLSQVLGGGGKTFFDTLKTGLQGILDILVTTTDEGTILNPQALELVSQFFSILTNVGQEMRNIFENFTLGDAVVGATRLANIVNLIVDVFSGFAQGFAEVFAFVADVIGDIVEGVGGLLELFGADLGDAADSFRVIARVLGTIVAGVLVGKGALLVWAFAAKLLYGQFELIAKALKFIAPLVKGMKVVFAALATSTALWVGAFILLGVVIALVVAAFTNDFIRSITVGGLKIGTLADLFKYGLVNAIRSAVHFFETAWAVSVAFVKGLFESIGKFFRDTILAVVEKVLEIASNVSDEAEKALKALRALKKVNKEIDKAALDKIAKEKAAKLAAIKAAEEEEAAANIKRLAQIAAAELSGPRLTLAEAAKKVAAEFRAALFGASDAAEDAEEAADKLVASFKELPPVVSQANASLAKQGKILETLKDKAEAAKNAIAFAVQSQGVPQAEARLLKARAEGLAEVKRASKSLDARALAAEKSAEKLASKQAKITKELLNQKIATRSQIKELLVLGALINDQEITRTAAEKSRAVLVTELAKAERSHNAEKVQGLKDRIAKIDEESDKIAQKILAEEKAVQLTVESLKLSEDQSNTLISKLTELLRLRGEEKAQRVDAINTIKVRGELEAKILDITTKKTIALLVLEQERLRVSAQRSAQELGAAQRTATAERATTGVTGLLGGTQSEGARKLTALSNELIALRQQTAERARQLALSELAINASVTSAAGSADFFRLAAEASLNLELGQARYNNELATSKLQAEGLALEMSRIVQTLDAPVAAGFRAGLEDFVVSARDTFAQVREIATASITGLADTISGILGDALDPTKKLDLLARFQQFFASITQMILQLLVRLLVVKALGESLGIGAGASTAAAEAAAATAVAAAAAAAAAAATASAAAAEAAAFSISGGGGFLSSFGFNQGGLISNTHSTAQGLASGGQPGRPSGLHHTDTIPIWAALGEFMHPVSAVQEYGKPFMESIRSLSLDPNLVKALMGVKSSSRSRHTSTTGSGYAAGGSIRNSRAAALAATQPNLTIVNVFDQQQLLTTLAETDGQEVLVNVIRSRSDDLRPAQ
ncbi:MAG: hypothetical protein JKY94_17500 [Rhodobacteraceae bacterium]|nr:hypothetical protein [Paracoccaceae bacterium]